MDFSKTDEYVREHWPAALLMAIVVIPASLAAGAYFRQPPASAPTDTKISDLTERLEKVNKQVQNLFTLYRGFAENRGRYSDEDIARLYTRSDPDAAKGKP